MVLKTSILLVILAGSMGMVGFKRDSGIHPVFTAVPMTLAPGGSGTVTVTVDQAGTTDTEIAISTTDSTDITVPSEVNLPAGHTSVQFTVTAPTWATIDAGGTITATANGSHATSHAVYIENNQ